MVPSSQEEVGSPRPLMLQFQANMVPLSSNKLEKERQDPKCWLKMRFQDLQIPITIITILTLDGTEEVPTARVMVLGVQKAHPRCCV